MRNILMAVVMLSATPAVAHISDGCMPLVAEWRDVSQVVLDAITDEHDAMTRYDEVAWKYGSHGGATAGDIDRAEADIFVAERAVSRAYEKEHEVFYRLWKCMKHQ